MIETEQTELIAALTPLILAVVALLLQELRRRDTDKHGDEFIKMLKGAGETLTKVAGVLPQTAPYVTEYNAVVAEAERIWKTSTLTAEDIQELGREARLVKSQIDLALAKYRELKAPA